MSLQKRYVITCDENRSGLNNDKTIFTATIKTSPDLSNQDARPISDSVRKFKVDYDGKCTAENMGEFVTCITP
jgi:hypothetical protein